MRNGQARAVAGPMGQGMLALSTAAVLVAAATWLVFEARPVLAGVVAALAGAALLVGAVLARREGHGLLSFVDSGVDRAFDGCLLAAIALTSRQADGPAAAAAVGALAASFLGAYVRARGVSLGYPIEEGLASRGLRYGTTSTLVPSRIRLVTRASQPIVTSGSR